MANTCYTCEAGRYWCTRCNQGTCQNHGYVGNYSSHVICPPAEWFNSIVDLLKWEQQIEQQRQADQQARGKELASEYTVVAFRAVKLLQGSQVTTRPIAYVRLIPEKRRFREPKIIPHYEILGHGWELPRERDSFGWTIFVFLTDQRIASLDARNRRTQQQGVPSNAICVDQSSICDPSINGAHSSMVIPALFRLLTQHNLSL